MTDEFAPLPMESMARWMFEELASRESVFGLPRELFFVPREDDAFAMHLLGRRLDTPIGVAAGPHTQLAQNLVVAWLAGARFLELKTVQTLDELQVTKPCIDMEDVGYNCEWSQELRLVQSFDEYLKAWILIHALRERLGHSGETGFQFNMSVGYNLAGIRNANVQRYLASIASATERKRALVAEAARTWSRVADLEIPDRLTDSVTLSTMHGCPPDEIERIGRYLIEELGLNTSIKLNPTLLGPTVLRGILNDELGFDDIEVPDAAFAHDPRYEDAMAMVRALRAAAKAKGVAFGLKLSNTLEVVNRGGALPAKEAMLYMSGRSLHPLTVELARRISEEFEGDIPISFAGGADAFNLAHLVAGNLAPVTVCSDLLRPGGYGRLAQYIDELRGAMAARSARDPAAFVLGTALADPGRSMRFRALLREHAEEVHDIRVGDAEWAQFWRAFDGAPATTHPVERARQAALAAGATVEAADQVAGEAVKAAARANLEGYAIEVRRDERYHKPRRRLPTKTATKLGAFDCIEAPCQEGCPASQNVPDYMYLVANGRYEEAMDVLLRTNPLPNVTGCVCDHPCIIKCVRVHYDAPLAIREVKRFITEQNPEPRPVTLAPDRAVAVAVVGAGPGGLAAAHFLALEGFRVTVFEAREKAGGVPSDSIPSFRISEEALARDLAAIERLGVTFRFGVRVGRDVSFEDLRAEGFRYVYIGIGAGAGKRLAIPGEDAAGVVDCLDFLADVRAGKAQTVGRRVVIVGAGNSAMDAARTAWRLVGAEGDVTVVYRRTIAEMPADPEEVDAILHEGVAIRELAAPVRVVTDGGRVVGLECQRMTLGERDASGRPRPVAVPDSAFVVPAETVIVAISQTPLADFLARSGVAVERDGRVRVDPVTFETSLAGVFAGGDVVRGPSSIIQAEADARAATDEMLRRESGEVRLEPTLRKDVTRRALVVRKARRVYPAPRPELPLAERRSFLEVLLPLTEEEARREAARCLDCDEMCSMCVSVCPNLANVAYDADPFEARLEALVVRGGAIERGPATTFRVTQPVQILNVGDFCNECGDCETFCPTSGAPYKDKPRLCLTDASFAHEARGTRVERTADGWRLRAKREDGLHTLVREGDTLRYEAPKLEATLRAEGFAIVEVRPGARAADGDELSLAPAAGLFVLAQSLVSHAAFLL